MRFSLSPCRIAGSLLLLLLMLPVGAAPPTRPPEQKTIKALISDIQTHPVADIACEVAPFTAGVLSTPAEVEAYMGSFFPDPANPASLRALHIRALMQVLRIRVTREAQKHNDKDAIILIGLLIDMTRHFASIDPPATVTISDLPVPNRVPSALAPSLMASVKDGLGEVRVSFRMLQASSQSRLTSIKTLDSLLDQVYQWEKQKKTILNQLSPDAMVKVPSAYSPAEARAMASLTSIDKQERAVCRKGLDDLKTQFLKDATKF